MGFDHHVRDHQEQNHQLYPVDDVEGAKAPVGAWIAGAVLFDERTDALALRLEVEEVK